MSDPKLPSIADIRAASVRLTDPERGTQVVRIGDFVIKYGPNVDLVEAKNIPYVDEHCDVRVPKLYASFAETGTKSNFIVMEYIHGTQLDELWPSMTDTERLEVENQLRIAINKLRSMKEPGYLGTPERGPFNDFTLRDFVGEPGPYPFDDEKQFNQAMVRRLRTVTNAAYASFLEETIHQTMQGHRTVFTHGDFQMKNILARRKEGGGFELTLIDWEFAGWYPEYWEFSNAAIPAQLRPEWFEICRRVLPVYHQEFILMQHIRNIIFC